MSRYLLSVCMIVMTISYALLRARNVSFRSSSLLNFPVSNSNAGRDEGGRAWDHNFVPSQRKHSARSEARHLWNLIPRMGAGQVWQGFRSLTGPVCSLSGYDFVQFEGALELRRVQKSGDGLLLPSAARAQVFLVCASWCRASCSWHPCLQSICWECTSNRNWLTLLPRLVVCSNLFARDSAFSSTCLPPHM